MKKAVFFDKDGTLIPDIPYNRDINAVTFSEGAQTALKKLAHEYRFFVVTNQAGVARGRLSEEDIQHTKVKLSAMFAELGVALEGFYYCPHDVNGTVAPYNVACSCRKPLPGMLLKASEEHSVNLSESWFVGDILNDVEAGNRAGCRTILLDNGNETEWLRGAFREPTFMVRNLDEAADTILAHLEH